VVLDDERVRSNTHGPVHFAAEPARFSDLAEDTATAEAMAARDDLPGSTSTSRVAHRISAGRRTS
jgi:hypothetical protein